MKKIINFIYFLTSIFLSIVYFFFFNAPALKDEIFETNESMTTSEISNDIIDASGNHYTKIYLNVKNEVTLSNGNIAYFIYTPELNFYFTVETFGMYNTKIKVENTSTGTIINDDSGEGLNAKVEFKGIKGQPVYISTKFYSSSTSGTFKLQLRKQRFSMFGYEDSEGNNTIPDLAGPYNAFNSLFESIKYENGSSGEALSNDDRDLARINSEIMFFTGHGFKSNENNMGYGVAFKYGGITTNNALNMNKTKVAMWAACYSANSTNSGKISISEYSINCGAKSSIGFSESVSFSSSKTFTNRFFTNLASGSTVKEAAEYGASGLLWPWDNGKKYVIFGDKEMSVIDCSTSISTFDLKPLSLSLIDNLDVDYEYISLDETNGRYYKKINNCLSNNFIDVTYKEGKVVKIDDYRKKINNILKINPTYLNYTLPDKKRIGTQTFILEEETTRNIIYYAINNSMTPIEIIVGKYNDGCQIIEEVTCVNLALGHLIDYSDINEI